MVDFALDLGLKIAGGVISGVLLALLTWLWNVRRRVRAVPNPPRKQEPWIQVFYIALENDQYRAALETLQKVTPKTPHQSAFLEYFEGRRKLAQGFHRDAMLHLQRSEGHAIENGDRWLAASSLAASGVALCRLGSPREGEVKLRAAMAIFSEDGRKHEKVDAQEDLGNALVDQGRFREAAYLLQFSARYHFLSRNRASTARALINLARVRRGSVLIQRAALEFALRSGKKRLVHIASLNLATAILHRGKVQQARVLVEQVLLDSRERGDEVVTAMALAGLAEFDRLQGNWDDATIRAESARAAFQRLGHKDGEVKMLGIEGLCCEARGDFQGAERRYRLLIAEAADHKLPDALCNGLWVLRNLFNRTNRAREFNQIRDSALMGRPELVKSIPPL